MKRILFVLLLSLSTFASFAHHTKGGWMYYEYLGPGINDPSKLRYRIVLKEYMICNPSPGQLDQQVNFSFFNAGTNQFIENVSVPLHDTIHVQNCTSPICHPCISNIPLICYTIADYETIKELSPSVSGYTIGFSRCCRIDNIINIVNSDMVGDTWIITIPGTQNLATAPQNSSPQFIANDTAIICTKNYFTFDFTATDADRDSLVYAFAPAYDGGSSGIPSPNIASNPPLSVPYQFPYSALQPLGSGVTINSSTGIVSGIAPDMGEYVITAVVKEYRNGVYFAESRKSLHITVASCNPITVQLDPQYTVCDTYSHSFSNNTINPPGITYFWDFGDSKSGANNTSTSSNPTHTYSDTGTYKLKLTVTLNGQCTNSDSSIVKVYPFFFPGFISTGICKNTPIQFTDTTKTTYGVVNSWSWNFGDPSTAADTSHVKNPQYSYSTAGNYDVTLSATNSKGCSGSVTHTISIKDKPDLTVTNDTLICSIDTLQLNAVGSGNILWTPNYNINNQNTPSPLVSPDVPTKYYVTLTDPFGCTATDSVFVDVKQFVTIDAGRDTSICAGDAIQLNPVSDALHYNWSPAAPLDNPLIKNPTATPAVTTTFYVIGNIGKCQSTDSVTIRVAPYPGAGGIPDTTICFGNSVQLHATGGSQYTWSPPLFLSNPNIADPIANPIKSIQYIVTIRDTLGCPKPSYDTVVVLVQNIIADAGPRDTSIVINQPLQLNATGGQFYFWTPSTGLNNASIPNPVAILNDDIDYVVNVSTAAGCFDTDTISVKVFKVLPGFYVPSAFTPNGDGNNDVFRPILIGIKQINYFKVYNRWGVLVYSSDKNVSEQSIGWDGRYKGRPQDPDVFVWIAEGVDYLDKKIIQKGTVTLIR